MTIAVFAAPLVESRLKTRSPAVPRSPLRSAERSATSAQPLRASAGASERSLTNGANEDFRGMRSPGVPRLPRAVKAREANKERTNKFMSTYGRGSLNTSRLYQHRQRCINSDSRQPCRDCGRSSCRYPSCQTHLVGQVGMIRTSRMEVDQMRSGHRRRHSRQEVLDTMRTSEITGGCPRVSPRCTMLIRA
jgi:hypothetical protein